MVKDLKKIVLASGNPGKIQEITALLAPLQIEIVPQSFFGIKDIEETGNTFIENALLKARNAAKIANLPALADDSGLVVKALDGAPGIYSARYAGEPSNATNNINKLLETLSTIPLEKRQAYFYCVLVLLKHEKDPSPIVCEGKWQGSILLNPQGKNGFGYDPIFYVPTEKKSAAELTASRKNLLSHRAIALQCLIKTLAESI